MEESLLSAVHWLLGMLALPSVGLSAIFTVSLVSATLLPLGSEPAVFGYIKLSPDMFWPAVLVATAGNTVGGAISYWMGLGAEKAVERWKEAKAPTPHPQSGLAAPQGGVLPLGRPGGEKHPHSHPDATEGGRMRGRWNERAHDWIHRMGPPALLLSWLPAVGDPLCAVAGWLRLPFWPCVVYMAIGKFLRYLVMTASLLWFFPGQL
ncbi:YqaA family protein [Achromobacter marplatensis]|jgi:membrane protein YqaA with SNARE-associated domain|nr:YqaA family protein [Achromobacter marplatensis]MDH2054696.1 DedA family protein [Achromobacter marplatensis]